MVRVKTCECVRIPTHTHRLYIYIFREKDIIVGQFAIFVNFQNLRIWAPLLLE